MRGKSNVEHPGIHKHTNSLDGDKHYLHDPHRLWYVGLCIQLQTSLGLRSYSIAPSWSNDNNIRHDDAWNDS